MGRWGYLFFSELIAQKEAFKETLKDPDEIAEVQKEIDELRKHAEFAKADEE